MRLSLSHLTAMVCRVIRRVETMRKRMRLAASSKQICNELNQPRQLRSTGLFNPSGRNQEAVRPGIDGAIPKSFWLVVTTFCSFNILCLMPW